MNDEEAAETITLPATPPRAASHRIAIIAILLLVVIVGALGVASYAIYAVAQNRNALQAQVVEQNNEIACRSRANFNTVRATAEVIQIVSELVEAQGNTEKVATIRPLLGPANAALNDAIAAQDRAIPSAPGDVSTCSPAAP